MRILLSLIPILVLGCRVHVDKVQAEADLEDKKEEVAEEPKEEEAKSEEQAKEETKAETPSDPGEEDPVGKYLYDAGGKNLGKILAKGKHDTEFLVDVGEVEGYVDLTKDTFTRMKDEVQIELHYSPSEPWNGCGGYPMQPFLYWEDPSIIIITSKTSSKQKTINGDNRIFKSRAEGTGTNIKISSGNFSIASCHRTSKFNPSFPYPFKRPFEIRAD